MKSSHAFTPRRKPLPLKVQERTVSFGLSVLLALTIAVGWTFGLKSIEDSKNSILKNETDHLRRLVSSISDQMYVFFDRIESDLRVVDLWMSQNPERDPLGSPELTQFVEQFQHPERGRIFFQVMQANGDLLELASPPTSTTENLADWKNILDARDGGSNPLAIGVPTVRSKDGKRVVPVAVAVRNPRRNAEYLVASIEMDWFQEIFENYRPKPGGAVSLSTIDSKLLVRAPIKPELFGKTVINQEGRQFLASRLLTDVRTQISPIDGLEKLVAYGRPRVEGPFQITCSVALRDVLAEWGQNRNVTFALIWGLTLLVALLGIALLAALNKMTRSNLAQSKFLSQMAHELRTPLNGILGSIELFPRAGLNSDQTEWMEEIQTTGIRLKEIVNEILDWNRLDSGKARANETEFSLRRALESSVGQFRRSAAQKGLTLDLEFHPEELDALRGDERKIRHVVDNLLANAIKWTETGGIVVSAEISGSSLIVSVRDTGPGIEAKTMARLFQAFERGEDSSDRHREGTGLGLAISLELARLMKGGIEVESTPGRGSIFRLVLPYSPALAPSSSDPRPQASSSFRFREKRVLVVEDNPLNAKILVRILQQYGIEPQTASDGAMAVRTCRHNAFDLIFMDIQMPEMDGYEATAAIRALSEQGRRVPIVALSAHALPEEKARSIERGMNAHLSKPLAKSELEEILEKYLDGAETSKLQEFD